MEAAAPHGLPKVDPSQHPMRPPEQEDATMRDEIDTPMAARCAVNIIADPTAPAALKEIFSSGIAIHGPTEIRRLAEDATLSDEGFLVALRKMKPYLQCAVGRDHRQLRRLLEEECQDFKVPSQSADFHVRQQYARRRYHRGGYAQRDEGESHESRANLLHVCAAFGRSAAARYCVLHLHYDVDCVMPRTAETALSLAVQQDQVACVQTLLQLGADVTVKDARGQPLVHQVTLRGTPAIKAAFEASSRSRLGMRKKQLRLAKSLHKEAAMCQLDDIVLRRYAPRDYRMAGMLRTVVRKRQEQLVTLAEMVGVAPSSHKGTVLHKYSALSKRAGWGGRPDAGMTEQCLSLIAQASGSMAASRNSVGAHPLHYAIESKHNEVANALIRHVAREQRRSDAEHLALVRREAHARGIQWLNPARAAPTPSERPLQLSTGSMANDGGGYRGWGYRDVPSKAQALVLQGHAEEAAREVLELAGRVRAALLRRRLEGAPKAEAGEEEQEGQGEEAKEEEAEAAGGGDAAAMGPSLMATLLRQNGTQLVVMVPNRAALDKCKQEQGIALEENCIELDYQVDSLQVVDGQLRPVAKVGVRRKMGARRGRAVSAQLPSWGMLGLPQSKGRGSAALNSSHLENMAMHLRELVQRSQREKALVEDAKSILSGRGPEGEGGADGASADPAKPAGDADVEADEDLAEGAEGRIETGVDAQLDLVLQQAIGSLQHGGGDVHEQQRKDLQQWRQELGALLGWDEQGVNVGDATAATAGVVDVLGGLDESDPIVLQAREAALASVDVADSARLRIAAALLSAMGKEVKARRAGVEQGQGQGQGQEAAGAEGEATGGPSSGAGGATSGDGAAAAAAVPAGDDEEEEEDEDDGLFEIEGAEDEAGSAQAGEASGEGKEEKGGTTTTTTATSGGGSGDEAPADAIRFDFTGEAGEGDTAGGQYMLGDSVSCPATTMLAAAWRDRHYPLTYAVEQYGGEPVPSDCVPSRDRGTEHRVRPEERVAVHEGDDDEEEDFYAGVDVAGGGAGEARDTKDAQVNPFFTMLTEIPNGPGLASAATHALPAAAEHASDLNYVAALLSAGARPNQATCTPGNYGRPAPQCIALLQAAEKYENDPSTALDMVLLLLMRGASPRAAFGRLADVTDRKAGEDGEEAGRAQTQAGGAFGWGVAGAPPMAVASTAGGEGEGEGFSSLCAADGMTFDLTPAGLVYRRLQKSLQLLEEKAPPPAVGGSDPEENAPEGSMTLEDLGGTGLATAGGVTLQALGMDQHSFVLAGVPRCAGVVEEEHPVCQSWLALALQAFYGADKQGEDPGRPKAPVGSAGTEAAPSAEVQPAWIWAGVKERGERRQVEAILRSARECDKERYLRCVRTMQFWCAKRHYLRDRKVQHLVQWRGAIGLNYRARRKLAAEL